MKLGGVQREEVGVKETLDIWHLGHSHRATVSASTRGLALPVAIET